MSNVVLLAVNMPQIKPNGPAVVVSHDHMSVYFEIMGSWVRMDLELAESAIQAMREAVKEIRLKPPPGKAH